MRLFLWLYNFSPRLSATFPLALLTLSSICGMVCALEFNILGKSLPVLVVSLFIFAVVGFLSTLVVALGEDVEIEAKHQKRVDALHTWWDNRPSVK